VPKESYILFFLVSTAILAVVQFFVFSELKRYLRTTEPLKAPKLLRIFRWMFIVMNIPVVFVYFRRQIAPDLPTVTNFLLYPYTVWVFLLIIWTLILIPIVVVRILRTTVFK
jgi:hypothetical protein